VSSRDQETSGIPAGDLPVREEKCCMARVLLTGSPGGVGRAAHPVLEAAGLAVEPFDLTDGQDLRDEAAVRRAMQGCEAAIYTRSGESVAV
jgi:nucleoside-diphosphate-sugar epimerase